MSTRDVEFTRCQSGWFFSRGNKREIVGQFQADVYSVQGISLISQKRREHLTEEDLAKNKEALVESFTKPSSNSNYELGSNSGDVSILCMYLLMNYVLYL